MIGMILTGHGTFAPGLAGALEMIAGPQDFFEAVPFVEGDDVTSFEANMAQKVEELAEKCEGVLIFSDLLGGSPFKTAMLASQHLENVEVLAGTNLPMLIETAGLRYAVTDLNQLIEQAVNVGQTGVIHAKLVIKEDAEDEGDGI